MSQYRTRPLIVTAEQWFPDKEIDGVETRTSHGIAAHYVTTANEQQVYLQPGDWIIAEPNGNGHYPVKDEIFRSQYEPVSDQAVTVLDSVSMESLIR